jgi:hypothetical protein
MVSLERARCAVNRGGPHYGGGLLGLVLLVLLILWLTGNIGGGLRMR